MAFFDDGDFDGYSYLRNIVICSARVDVSHQGCGRLNALVGGGRERRRRSGALSSRFNRGGEDGACEDRGFSFIRPGGVPEGDRLSFSPSVAVPTLFPSLLSISNLPGPQTSSLFLSNFKDIKVG